MAKYLKGDCRNHGGQIKSRSSQYPRLVKGTAWFSGKNRHERRADESLKKYTLKAKGTPGIKIIRRMFRKNGVKETTLMMSGANRGMRFHEGYAKLGAYTREGFKLTNPRK